MTEENGARNKGPLARGGKPSREDRLKAALKANMARRKAQARARADSATEEAGADDVSAKIKE